MTTLDGGRGGVAAVVPAAGAGVRLGPGVPKAFRPLGGEPLLVHAVRRLVAGGASCLVIAAPAGQEAAVRDLVAPQQQAGMQITVVPGGEDRQRSVAAALAAVPPGCGIVLVHDAARALVPTSLVEDVVAAVRAGWDAVIPVLPVTDTITQVDAAGLVAATLDRSALRAVQTPQGFRRQVLEQAHAAAANGLPDGAGAGGPATDDAGLVARLGIPVHTVPGSEQALKITSRRDLNLAESLLLADATDRSAGDDPSGTRG